MEHSGRQAIEDHAVGGGAAPVGREHEALDAVARHAPAVIHIEETVAREVGVERDPVRARLAGALLRVDVEPQERPRVGHSSVDPSHTRVPLDHQQISVGQERERVLAPRPLTQVRALRRRAARALGRLTGRSPHGLTRAVMESTRSEFIAVGSGGRGGAGPVDLAPIAGLMQRVVARWQPMQVWLFGSRARGDSAPSSDWDLFVIVPDETSEAELDPLVAWRVQSGSGVHADVILCREREFVEDASTPNTLAFDVSHEGVLLHER